MGVLADGASFSSARALKTSHCRTRTRETSTFLSNVPASAETKQQDESDKDLKKSDEGEDSHYWLVAKLIKTTESRKLRVEARASVSSQIDAILQSQSGAHADHVRRL